MKGYLTLYISLSLSCLLTFVLVLIGGAYKGAARMKIECAADASCQSVLAEYSRQLQKQYDLFYIDLSYLNQAPSLEALEGRMKWYLMQNCSEYTLEGVQFEEYAVASDDGGQNMESQAVSYMKEMDREALDGDLDAMLSRVISLEQRDTQGEWSALQEQIAVIPLPVIRNKKGQLEEVALNNPADAVYALLGSDVLYLAGLSGDQLGNGQEMPEPVLSKRTRNQGKKGIYQKEIQSEQNLFLTYLFDKLGFYRHEKEGTYLGYEIEYAIYGKRNDKDNLEAVAKHILKWRFAENAETILGDASQTADALALADTLQAVMLKPEFRQPVAKSILYAWAYQESLKDLQIIFQGGAVGGLNYRQYLALLLRMSDREQRNLRVLDVMEINIQTTTGNPFFAMDWCVESYRSRISIRDSFGKNYVVNRTYGYY